MKIGVAKMTPSMVCRVHASSMYEESIEPIVDISAPMFRLIVEGTTEHELLRNMYGSHDCWQIWSTYIPFLTAPSAFAAKQKKSDRE